MLGLRRVGCRELGICARAFCKLSTRHADYQDRIFWHERVGFLKQLGLKLYDVPAIIITGNGSEERAVAAIEAGAFWYSEKPVKLPVLHTLLDCALSKAQNARQLAVL